MAIKINLLTKFNYSAELRGKVIFGIICLIFCSGCMAQGDSLLRYKSDFNKTRKKINPNTFEDCYGVFSEDSSIQAGFCYTVYKRDTIISKQFDAIGNLVIQDYGLNGYAEWQKSYRSGLKHGLWYGKNKLTDTYWYLFNYFNDTIQGNYIEFNDSGMVSLSAYFDRGAPDGTWLLNKKGEAYFKGKVLKSYLKVKYDFNTDSLQISYIEGNNITELNSCKLTLELIDRVKTLCMSKKTSQVNLYIKKVASNSYTSVSSKFNLILLESQDVIILEYDHF